jgi:predicted nucleotidyltransferase
VRFSIVADFLALLQALREHDVQFIVVGGVCAVLHGAPISTLDLDIVHARDDENLAKLERALAELDAVYREASWRQLRPTAERLRSAGHHLLITRAGPLDILGEIVGGRGYSELLPASQVVELEGFSVSVLELASLIAVKEELRRERDLAVLPILRRLLEEGRRS